MKAMFQYVMFFYIGIEKKNSGAELTAVHSSVVYIMITFPTLAITHHFFYQNELMVSDHW